MGQPFPSPAPGLLVPAQDLVNTWFGELTGTGHEGLATATDLAQWCRGHGVDVDEVSAADLEVALVVREGMRAALAPHNDSVLPGDAAARQRLEEVAESLELRVSLSNGPSLIPQRGGVAGALTTVLAGPVLAGEPTWARLKVCRDPRCRTAFYDYSRNGSGVWCSMTTCGAANKQRAFVERRRARNAAARSGR